MRLLKRWNSEQAPSGPRPGCAPAAKVSKNSTEAGVPVKLEGAGGGGGLGGAGGGRGGDGGVVDAGGRGGFGGCGGGKGVAASDAAPPKTYTLPPEVSQLELIHAPLEKPQLL